jgi:hypothetical protein
MLLDHRCSLAHILASWILVSCWEALIHIILVTVVHEKSADCVKEIYSSGRGS